MSVCLLSSVSVKLKSFIPRDFYAKGIHFVDTTDLINQSQVLLSLIFTVVYNIPIRYVNPLIGIFILNGLYVFFSISFFDVHLFIQRIFSASIFFNAVTAMWNLNALHSGVLVLVGNGNYIVIMDNRYTNRRLLPFDNLFNFLGHVFDRMPVCCNSNRA